MREAEQGGLMVQENKMWTLPWPCILKMTRLKELLDP